MRKMKGMKRVIGRVPRGFTRFYVLSLLKETPMTGKEIIDEAEKQSGGAWKPSPGLIYPLLGRLVRGGLIEEVEGGRFTITPRGEETLKKYTMIQEQLEWQLRVVRRLGLSLLTAGKYLAEDAMDRITAVIARVHEMVSRGSRDIQKSFYASYKAFLESELRRLEEESPREEASEPPS